MAIFIACVQFCWTSISHSLSIKHNEDPTTTKLIRRPFEKKYEFAHISKK